LAESYAGLGQAGLSAWFTRPHNAEIAMNGKAAMGRRVGASVFIVEDAAAVRDRLRRAIEELGHARLAGVADSEADAIRGILDTAPDLVILDLQLRLGSGMRVLQEIRAQGCSAFVVVQTNFALPGYRDRCLRLGADRFLDKTEDASRLLELIEEVTARIAPRGDLPSMEKGA